MRLDPSELSCRFLGGVLRLAYGFRVEGAENMPAEGPYIGLNIESSLLCILCDSAASATLLLKPAREKKLMTFIGEEAWASPLFRRFARVINSYPLLPHGAGQFGLHLLRALEHLRQGGVVVMNPEGDLSRDGRPLPVRDGVAWLGLHSGAPIVPIIVSASAYDIWPNWRDWPSAGGRVVQRVGVPFRLCEQPLGAVGAADLERANARLRAEMDRLCYGPEGVAGWAGPVEGSAEQRAPGFWEQTFGDGRARTPEGFRPAPTRQRGLAQLLWRCPVCGADDAVVHERPRLRRQGVRCVACGTRWALRHVPGHDFRLQVVAGDARLLGLEMALSAWYDLIKARLRLRPLVPVGVALAPGEEAFLRADGVTLLVDRACSLADPSWRGEEPPERELPRGPADWARLGPGRLWLTNRRLVWEGPATTARFSWEKVTALSLRLYSLLGITYGNTPYRFWLAADNGLKWLNYAGALARGVGGEGGRRMTVSPY